MEHAAGALVESKIDEVVVVLGHQSRRVAKALDNLPVGFVINERHDRGQSTSVRAGVRAAKRARADAVVIALGDMPFVSPSTVSGLIDRNRETDENVVVPTYRGQRGNPVLFSAEMFEELMSLTGDTGAKQLFESTDAVRFETDDFGTRIDIDTPEDLDRIESIDAGRRRF